jgi:5,10-methenyltetrahydromethanopterin hydrogenase
MNTERYVGDNKLHEMVEIAIQEDWDVCVTHMECVAGMMGQMIAQGVASGEFEAPDLQLASLCACTVFSTLLSEVADMRFVGTALTAQTAMGFGLSTVSIQLVPVLAETAGWQYAFLLLAPGPL